MWRSKGLKIANNNIGGNKNKARELTLLNFKTYSKGRVIKALWYW